MPDSLLDQLKISGATRQDCQRVAIELASQMQTRANELLTPAERRRLNFRSKIIRSAQGRHFLAEFADSAFRSNRPLRIAQHIVSILKYHGIPRKFPLLQYLKLLWFRWFGKQFAKVLVPIASAEFHAQISDIIVPGETKGFNRHLAQRRHEGVHLNINFLGESVLGEEEALRRLGVVVNALANPKVTHVSVKISSLYSQINWLAWDYTVSVVSERLRELYRAAITNLYENSDGSLHPKWVDLDMEGYADMELTVTVFKKVLSEPEFLAFSAGIALQAYLPDAYAWQKKLTRWAQNRVAKGGAAIKIRLVKGANLGLEQVTASLKGWKQAPFTSKQESDANFKRMLHFGCQPKNAVAVMIGVASHNIFDLAYAMALRSYYNVESQIHFEMLEGMAPHLNRVVLEMAGDLLLYAPVARNSDFQQATAYLVRRFEENSGKDNFLRDAFNLEPDGKSWKKHLNQFQESFAAIPALTDDPRRLQIRITESVLDHTPDEPFENEPDTDWTFSLNRKWIAQISNEWKSKSMPKIPILGGKGRVERVLNLAAEMSLGWAEIPLNQRGQLLFGAAQLIRQNRGSLIGVMMAAVHKSAVEADSEVSEAIDFINFYRKMAGELFELEDLKWEPKGPVLVAPPWNFPCSIPVGCIAAALLTGNPVIFKPAPEAVWVGWELVQLFWQAGIPKNVLQFVHCEEETVGSALIKDTRVAMVALTGAYETARRFIDFRPNLDLIAETGGKNSIIITSLADRDLAIRDSLQSAFGYSGQKCSAAGLLICEAEVYDDPKFKKQLLDAAKSMNLGSAFDFRSEITPLIHKPLPTLFRALTSVDRGETWLLKPKQQSHHPLLWSPGIKWGVLPGSFMHKTELFGPVLGVMRADNLDHAIALANATGYGLTAGLHSLDVAEQDHWLNKIEAGNCYINRTITGAIVRRQPFGGCKKSSFGPGLKAGGPNYLIQFMNARQQSLPRRRVKAAEEVEAFSQFLQRADFTDEEHEIWQASIESYTHWWNQYRNPHDVILILGQDNLRKCVPHHRLTLRLTPGVTILDWARVCAAMLVCGTPFDISYSGDDFFLVTTRQWRKLFESCVIHHETDEEFIVRLQQGHIDRLRLLATPSDFLLEVAGMAGCYVISKPVLANGRVELLHYIREVSISRDYHRYGNLGSRDMEMRKPVL